MNDWWAREREIENTRQKCSEFSSKIWFFLAKSNEVLRKCEGTYAKLLEEEMQRADSPWQLLRAEGEFGVAFSSLLDLRFETAYNDDYNFTDLGGTMYDGYCVVVDEELQFRGMRAGYSAAPRGISKHEAIWMVFEKQRKLNKRLTDFVIKLTDRMMACEESYSKLLRMRLDQGNDDGEEIERQIALFTALLQQVDNSRLEFWLDDYEPTGWWPRVTRI